MTIILGKPLAKTLAKTIGRAFTRPAMVGELMANALIANALIASLVVGGFALTSVVTAPPVAAQGFSEGYNFLKAVRDREGEEVTKTLNEPGSTIINTRDVTTGESALHIVTARRDVAWVRFLTARGANPNIEDVKGVTPLQIASRLGMIEAVEVLLKAGARVDNANSSGETALMAAVHRRDLAMVRLLLTNGANADRSDNSGRTARDYAALLTGSSQILEAIERSDEEEAAASAGPAYGPSF